MPDETKATDPNAVIPSKDEKLEVTKDWQKLLYTQDRVAKWVKGELTLRDLHGISGPEMLTMAMTGYSLYEQGKYDDALTIFEGLHALDKKESYYVTALGAVHMSKGDLETAYNCFTAAIQLNAKDLAAYVNRGEVHLRMGKVKEAANDLKRAVDLDPKGADPLSQRARVLAAAALETINAVKKGKAKNDPKGKPSKSAKPAAKSAAKKK